MRHARLDHWSRGTSFVHRRHPAAKIAATLVLLICIATLKPDHWRVGLAYLVLLCVFTLVARLPLASVLRAASVVLPFAIVFALFSVIARDVERGLAIVARAYLSGMSTVLLMATTSQPDLLAGLETLRAPRFLIQVMQFLYRYLLVLMEEAGTMRDAARSRAGRSRLLEFRRAAAAAGVLFARSSARANAIHLAMTARGFIGHIPRFRILTFSGADVYLLAAVMLPAIGLRLLAL